MDSESVPQCLLKIVELFSWSSVVCSFLKTEDRVTHLFYFQLIQSIQANFRHGTN